VSAPKSPGKISAAKATDAAAGPSESSAHGNEMVTALGPAGAKPVGAAPGDDRFVEHLVTAGELVASGRFREAEVEVLRALSGLPADLRALNLLALVRFKLGRLEEARATYREIAGAAPNDAAVRRNLGLLALKLDNIDEAIPELEMAARLVPADKQAWSYLGYAYAKKGQTVPAAAAFRHAGQDALAEELEHAATARRPSSNPKLASLQPGGTPQPATAPAGLDVPRGGTPAPAPLVLPPPSARPPSRVSEGAALAPASAVTARPSVVTAAVTAVPAPVTTVPAAAVTAAAPFTAVPAPVAAPTTAVQPAPVTATDLPPLEAGPLELSAVPLLGFVLSRLGVGPSPPAPRGEAFRLDVGDEAYVRAGVALAATGVQFEPAFRRMQGRRSTEPLASDGAPFFRLVGPGDVWVAGAPGAWQAVTLEDDILYVREDRVLAFDGGVSWEAGAVPGDGLRLLQFRGRGCVVLRLDAPPVAVKVTEDRPALVAREHLLGWVGRLVTHRHRPSGPSPFHFTCQGEGVVLFDPVYQLGDPQRVPVPPGVRSGGQSPPALVRS
jgi:uncharacterized protein (AIM24 family)